MEYSLSKNLVVDRKKKQLPVYYVTHAFRGSKGNYNEWEKVLFAVVKASRKLKPYFHSHKIRVKPTLKETLRRKKSI